MQATEDRLLEGVDPAFWSAYNAHPDDWVLLGAISDQCREAGRDDIAEFVDWLRTHRKYPTKSWHMLEYGWFNEAGDLPVENADFWTAIGVGDRPANALWRLWKWWEKLNTERKEEVRQWRRQQN